MTSAPQIAQANRNISLYPWFKLFRGLMFTQAIWFLYFQSVLTPAQAIMLYAISDITTTVLEVPSGYASDRIGRRLTLLISGVCSTAGTALLAFGDTFAVFVCAQLLIGAGGAFLSGTDSALLYESLVTAGREDEVEAQELRAWRFEFSALAISAAVGGAIGIYAFSLTFVVSAIALFCSVLICLRFREQSGSTSTPQPGEVVRFRSLQSALRKPVLIWLFVLSMVMYAFSHIPYVFGQPFIQEALEAVGLGQEAPLVSGFVTTAMMVTSVVASLFAPRLRRKIGLGAILLLAFGMQIALSAVLALTNAPIVIAILLLRMVPDAFSKPFMVARIQPELSDDARATYLSLQSLAGRAFFAATLFLASGVATEGEALAYADLQMILFAYVIVGLASVAALALFTRRVPLELTSGA